MDDNDDIDRDTCKKMIEEVSATEARADVLGRFSREAEKPDGGTVAGHEAEALIARRRRLRRRMR